MRPTARAVPRALSAAERELWDGAVSVLRANDAGGWTKPAPLLYPHQWSWDSAFIAIGLAHIDPERALEEIERLFRAQWTDGRLPHIVFNPQALDYFPGPELWSCAEVTAAAPRSPATSGLIQPPMHAVAVWRVRELKWAHGAAGFYQGEARGIFLGEEFHHNAVQIRSAQIGNVHPSWTPGSLRRRAVELALRGEVVPGGLPRLTLPVDEAAAGFDALARPGEVLQVALAY